MCHCGQLSQDNKQLKACARCEPFHYCSKKCQVVTYFKDPDELQPRWKDESDDASASVTPF
jgi:hypothetical protein